MSVTVFGSARRSASSAFNLIAVTTETASRLVNTAARSVDMLDAKVATIHQDVIMDCKLDRKHSELIKVIRKATEITDELEEGYSSITIVSACSFDRTVERSDK